MSDKSSVPKAGIEPGLLTVNATVTLTAINTPKWLFYLFLSSRDHVHYLLPHYLPPLGGVVVVVVVVVMAGIGEH